jgi:hypothetical protein
MRNQSPPPTDSDRPIPLRRNALRPTRPAAASESLRKIRNLIIFRDNHAQMRKDRRTRSGFNAVGLVHLVGLPLPNPPREGKVPDGREGAILPSLPSVNSARRS